MSNAIDALADKLVTAVSPHLATDDQREAFAQVAPSLVTLSAGVLNILRTELEGDPEHFKPILSDHLDGGDDIIASWDSVNGTWKQLNAKNVARIAALHEWTQDAIDALKIAIPIAIKLAVAL